MELDHPLLEIEAFTCGLPRPLGELSTPPAVAALLLPGSAGPFASDDALRTAVRDALRADGFKPTGRSKPASEYLIRAVSEGTLSSINAVVDLCNAASLHSGLPISVVDLDHVHPPVRLQIAPKATSYVFNASGQEMDVGGLACLYDAEGPCANAVKDSQRTKTSGATRRVLAVIWGTRARSGLARKVSAWYRDQLGGLGATTESA